MSLYSVIEIKAIEPLKIGAKGNKTNETEPSKNFVPGSTIRGMIISKIIRMKKFEGSEKKILSEMECYNAYPYITKRLFTPTPKHLRVDKHEWRKSKMSDESSLIVANLAHEPSEQNEKVKHSRVNELGFDFINIQGDKIEGLNISKEYRLHHSKVKKEENLFRYQAISSGSIFRSILKYDDSLKEIFDLLFEEEEFFAYIGGSKGTGYGRVNVKLVKKDVGDLQTTLECLGHKCEKEDNDSILVIRCLSDCIFRNEYGQPTNQFPKKIIEQFFGEKKEPSKHIVKTGISEGFNTKWGMRYPKESTLAAGSILVYELGKKASKEKIKEFEGKLHGQRTVDGYGWVSVNELFPDCVDSKEVGRSVAYIDKRIDLSKLREKDDFNILVNGMEGLKERWFNTIYRSLEKEERLRVSSLKNQHIRNMLSMLKTESLNKEQKKDGKDKGEKRHKIQDYMKDNTIFSLYDYNFLKLLDYINENGKLDEYIEIDKYANSMLGTQLGAVFYGPSYDRNSNKTFVNDLLTAILNMKAKGSDSSARNN